MKKDLQVVTVEGVRGYIDANGTAWLNAGDVARGLRWTQTAASGNESIRWERLNGYLAEFGYPQKVGTNDFIPESMFYRLVWKSRDERALAFQAKVADEILPSIRKHGAYLTVDAAERILYNPDFIIGLAQQVKNAQAERDKALLERDNARAEVIELKPRADYCQKVLNCDEALTTTLIAKDYGMGAAEFNQLLYKLRIQYRVGRTWHLYQQFADKGYMVTQSIELSGGKVVTQSYWTQKGRAFIYQQLKAEGIVPLRERRDAMANLF